MSTISSTSTTTTTNPYTVAYSTNDLSGSDTTASKYSTSKSSSSTSSSLSSGSYSQGLVSQMSGLDTNSMVNESMASDVIKLNSLLAKQQQSQWMQDRYRSVITNFQNFSSQYFDVLSSNYMLSANSFSVNAANSSDSNVLTASASNVVKIGTYSVTSATLATSASITSGSLTNSLGNKPAASDAISSMGISSGTLSFSIGGKNISYSLNSNSSISSVMQGLSSATGLNFNYSELTGKFSISTQGTGTSQNVNIQNISDTGNFFSEFGLNVNGGNLTTSNARIDGSAVIQNKNTHATASASDAISSTNLALINGDTLTFNVNGIPKSYTVDSTKSIGTLMSDLSNLTGATFSYNATSGRIGIESTGSSSLNITYDSGSTAKAFFGSAFGAAAGGTGMTQTSAAGTNGTFTIMEPGDTTGTTVSESSNNFTIDGVAYNFSGDTSGISSSNPVTINVKQDVSSVVNKIQNFVNDYNNLIDGIGSVTSEKRNYSYSPLTSSQESQMTASQITAWNQKAQQGLLQNDGTLMDMLSQMRAAFYTPVTGNGLSMASVGLSTSDDPSQGGKLTLDVSKLTAALQNNPQQVINLFNQTSSSYSSYTGVLNLDTTNNSQAINQAMATRNSQEGIFQRLSDIEQKYAGTYVDKNGNQGILLMKAGMPGSFSETRNTLYKEINDESSAVSDFKTKMADDEKMYSAKFTALQTALSQLSSQQSYLSSMLSSSSS